MNAITDTPVFMVQGIPSAMVESMWHFALPYVKRALDHSSGELLPDDLQERCRSTAAQLWLIAHDNRVLGAITTEIVRYPRRTHLRVITLGGTRFDEWSPAAHATLRGFAHSMGCQAVEAYTRRGFGPKLEKLGFRYKYAGMVDELGGNHG